MKPSIAIPVLAPPTQLSLSLAPAGLPADLPSLPEMVRARTLRQPWAGLVAAVPEGKHVGLKDLETREYRIAPGPLVICAGLKRDDDWTTALRPHIPEWAMPWTEIFGHAVALVLIGASRPLVEADFERAWWWESGQPRKAMEITRCWPFRRQFRARGMPGEFTLARGIVLEALTR